MRLPRLRTLLAPLLTLLIVAALAPACTSSSDSLTIYSGRSSDLIKPILDQFAQDTGTDITVKYGDSPELALLIGEEGEESPADIFISQTPGAVGYLEEKGLLAELSAETLELAPPEYESPSGRSIGLSGRRRVIVYNEDLVDPDDLPDSVLDLTAPEYEGQVAVAPTNGSFLDFVSAMRLDLGEEEAQAWLDGMAANKSPTYANNNAIVDAVSRGEVPMGLVNHYYNLRFLDEDPDLPSRNHYLPGDDIGSLLIFTAAGILESSDNKEAAEELVQYLLSPDAQKFFAEEDFEYPLAEGVEVPDVLEPLEPGDAYIIDYTKIGGDFETTITMINESGLGD